MKRLQHSRRCFLTSFILMLSSRAAVHCPTEEILLRILLKTVVVVDDNDNDDDESVKA